MHDINRAVNSLLARTPSVLLHYSLLEKTLEVHQGRTTSSVVRVKLSKMVIGGAAAVQRGSAGPGVIDRSSGC
jgi:hypothetical protein